MQELETPQESFPDDAWNKTLEFEETFSVGENGILTIETLNKYYGIILTSTIDLYNCFVFGRKEVKKILDWKSEAHEKWLTDQQADLANENRKRYFEEGERKSKEKIRKIVERQEEQFKRLEEKFQSKMMKQKSSTEKRALQIKQEAEVKRDESNKIMELFREQQDTNKAEFMKDITDQNQIMDKRLAEANHERMRKERLQEKKLNELVVQIQNNDTEEFRKLPDFLQSHKNDHPDSFYIQVIGGRGAGKSTFVNKVLKQLKLKPSAATGTEECTLETEFFSIAENLNCTFQWRDVFLCDQPGIGGLKIEKANYITKFGIGEFPTLLLLKS